MRAAIEVGAPVLFKDPGGRSSLSSWVKGTFLRWEDGGKARLGVVEARGREVRVSDRFIKFDGVTAARSSKASAQRVSAPAAEPRRVSTRNASAAADPKPAPPARSRDYLEFVRSKACAACHAFGPSEAHHFGSRGMGQKTSDFRTVPLCDRCHRAFHDSGRVLGASRVETERLFYRAQVDCLEEWNTVR